ncbi:MAG: hypothetical protein GX432_10550 [Candidatus Atribacteria bacterium]|jgi:hypothetical protein|nr:hypothetical protein [Candidatus Atribacteria bacterium]
MGNFRIEIDDSGVRKKLEDMQKNLKKVEEKQTVPFSELFNESFMFKYTRYSSFDEMLDKSGLMEKCGDFESIDDEKWDIFVKDGTDFVDWEEMKSEAVKIWALKKIGF